MVTPRSCNQRTLESHLPAERGQRAGACPVGLPVTVLEHVTHEIEVLLHRGEIIARCALNARAEGSPTSKRAPPARRPRRRLQRPTPEGRSREATPASGRQSYAAHARWRSEERRV